MSAKKKTPLLCRIGIHKLQKVNGEILNIYQALTKLGKIKVTYFSCEKCHKKTFTARKV